jgi:hypothetical protein
MPIAKVGLDWLYCITFTECSMKTYLLQLRTFHLLLVGFIQFSIYLE